ncbi:RNA polymerase sigma factor [Candidatus Laterigemmans baculatus]|uniref:RNA polymerase sigma factor n=1 Tax=Candidatus Laterigemmans baculatus TaxID=2770505 RepID=UPI00193B4BFE|nr:sigma-70 family RNA polymerase sigma factor [Candidatus Laterigemmans baculatus]
MSVQSFSSDESPSRDGQSVGGGPPGRDATVDDGELIRLAREGEAAAFDALVRRHADRLLRMVRNLTGTLEDAEDVTQETLAAAYFKLDSFAGRSSFFTWLYRIALNKSISRRRKRRIESTHRGQPLCDAAAVDHSDSKTDGNLERLVRDEQLERLRTAIAQLDPERQQVLVLRDVDARDYGEIAEILNIPKGTVRSRLHRARCDLRRLLEADSAGDAIADDAPSAHLSVEGGEQ